MSNIEYDKMVSHPDHYQSETGMEVIDVIEAFTFDLKGIEATDTGNIIKYICRWNKKNGLQDLNKAKWYLEHLIAHVEKMEKENKVLERVQAPYRVKDCIVATRTDADTVLAHMDGIVEKFGCVSVSDLYDLVGYEATYRDNLYGWYNLDHVYFERTADDEYLLKFPECVQFIGTPSIKNEKEND